MEGGQQVPGDGDAPQEVHGVGPQQDAAKEEEKRPPGLGTLTKHQGPDVQEHRKEGVAAPLLLLQVLDDVLVPVLGGQVQRRLPVPVPGLQLHGALGAEQLHRRQVARDAGQVQWRGPKVVRLLRIEAGVDEHLHESGEALVGGPVEGGVPVHVCEVRRSALAQQVGRGHGPPEHAGHHERGQPLVVGGVHRDPGAGAEQDVHHRHVPVPAGPVDGPGPLSIVTVKINPSALLN